MTDETPKTPDLRVVEQPSMSQADFEQTIATLAESILVSLPIAFAMCPGADPSNAPAIADFLAREHAMIASEILPRIANPDAAGGPDIAVEITHMATNQGIGISAPRRLEGVTDINQIAKAVMLFALAESPNARAILRLHGYAYAWKLSKPKPLVVL